jgi:hypothetical protein
MQHDNQFQEIVCKSWPDVKKQLAEYGPHWRFRGQRDASWGLETSFERDAKDFFDNYKLGRGENFPVRTLENTLSQAFQRRADHYLDTNHRPTSDLEWLALMQHHGAPTRLLDWTQSPYVACYFAIEDAKPLDHPYRMPEDAYCVVWAIDVRWCLQQGIPGLHEAGYPKITAKVPFHDEDYHDAVLSSDVPGVFPVTPFRMNERLAVQQGIFLIAGNREDTFMNNLLSCGPACKEKVHKIYIPRTCRSSALEDLERMNVSRTSLFPGLDGFAQSLKYRLHKISDLNRYGGKL